MESDPAIERVSLERRLVELISKKKLPKKGNKILNYNATFLIASHFVAIRHLSSLYI